MIRNTILILAAALVATASAQEQPRQQDSKQAASLAVEELRAQAELLADQARGRAVEQQQSVLEQMALAGLQTATAGQQLQSAVERLRTSGLRGPGREDYYYERGTTALDEGRWEKAAEAFIEAGKLNGRRAEGALYWKAYALNKQGQRDTALSTVQTLLTTYPNSRWANDAKALELEIKQSAGQKVSPQSEQDDELALLALNALQNSDPEQAVPILDKFLKSNRSPKLKERALFVLAQSRSPKAREALVQTARGGSNPDLQLRAVKYLGMFGGKDAAASLADIYQGTTDPDVKRSILRGFMVSRDQDRLFAAAKSEANPELRREAIRQLALIRPARSRSGAEADAGRQSAADMLASLYSTEQSPEIKKEIINSLFMQGSAATGKLVDLARKETDPALKKEIVQKLSVMKSKEATDYMLELLNK